MSLWSFIDTDAAAHAQLLAEAGGTPKLIAAGIAKLTASQVGGRLGGHFSFPPLWDWIAAMEPDPLD